MRAGQTMKKMLLMRQSFSLGILLAGLLIIPGCGKKEEAKAPAPPKAKVEARLVRVHPVQRRKMVERLELPGTIQPENVANILSTAEGKISGLLKREGDKVQKDEVVAFISSLVREDIINSARLILERKKKDLDQEPESPRLRNEHRQAQLDYEFALQQYKEIPVTSPISGVISQRWVDLGDMVPAKTRLFEIQSGERLKVDLPVSELDIGKLGLKQIASVKADACPERIFSGKIQRIHPLVDAKTRNGIVEIALDDFCLNLRAGMFVRVTFVVRTIEKALAVPVPAVIDRPESRVCFTIKDEKAVESVVKTGLEADGWVEILSGISEGDLVVIEGQEQLKTGMSVKIQPGQEKQKSPPGGHP
jgi:multidrug efflux pump subunit AcrA (membrane-fusion protein)